MHNDSALVVSAPLNDRNFYAEHRFFFDFTLEQDPAHYRLDSARRPGLLHGAQIPFDSSLETASARWRFGSAQRLSDWDQSLANSWKTSSEVETTSVMSCEWVLTLEAVSWAQILVVENGPVLSGVEVAETNQHKWRSISSLEVCF